MGQTSKNGNLEVRRLAAKITYICIFSFFKTMKRPSENAQHLIDDYNGPHFSSVPECIKIESKHLTGDPSKNSIKRHEQTEDRWEATAN